MIETQCPHCGQVSHVESGNLVSICSECGGSFIPKAYKRRKSLQFSFPCPRCNATQFATTDRMSCATTCGSCEERIIIPRLSDEQLVNLLDADAASGCPLEVLKVVAIIVLGLYALTILSYQ